MLKSYQAFRLIPRFKFWNEGKDGLWRWQFLVIRRRLQCHRAQVPILWKQSKGVRVNANVVVVDVVSQQPLK